VKKHVWLWLGVVLLLALWPAQAAAGSTDLGTDGDRPIVSVDGGRIFVDEDVALEPGERFEGDLGIFDGDLTVPPDSVVEGDVFITNGDARVEGRIEGDLAVISGRLVLSEGGRVEGDLFGMAGEGEIAGRVGGDASWMFGNAELRSSAVVEGDLMVLSGDLERQAGARVLGEELPDVRLPDLPLLRERPTLPEVREQLEIPPRVSPPQQRTVGQRVGSFVGRLVSAGLMGLLFVGLSLLIVLIWPRPTHRVAECLTQLPAQSLGLGLLTFLLAAGLESLAMVLMILFILVAAALISTVILIPVGLLLILVSMLLLLPVPLALAAGMVLGWVAVAEVVGRKVAQLLRGGKVSALGAVFIGLLVTVPPAALLWALKPVCCGWPFIILLTSVGLGGVFHTRFGRQSCQTPAESAPLPAEAMDEEAGQPDVPPPASA
jgi:hypothetical protein